MRTDILERTLQPPLPTMEGPASQLVKKVAVIGLPLAGRLVEVGHKVSGIDINTRLVDTLAEGSSPLEAFSDEDINEEMPGHVVETTRRSLQHKSKSIEQSKLLVLGLSYKPDVADVRESPPLKILDLLIQSGATVSIHDPFVDETSTKAFDDISHVDLNPEVIARFDAVLLLCDHSCFVYEMIRRNAALLIDTRGRFSSSLPNVVGA